MDYCIKYVLVCNKSPPHLVAENNSNYVLSLTVLVDQVFRGGLVCSVYRQGLWAYLKAQPGQENHVQDGAFTWLATGVLST